MPAMPGGDSSDEEQDTGVFSRWGKKLAGYFSKEKAQQKEVRNEGTGKSNTEIEAAVSQKRAWLDQQAGLGFTEQLATWPSHLIESFYVVGLPPDTEVTQVAYDLLAHERLARESEAGSSTRIAMTSSVTTGQPPLPPAAGSSSSATLAHAYTRSNPGTHQGSSHALHYVPRRETLARTSLSGGTRLPRKRSSELSIGIPTAQAPGGPAGAGPAADPSSQPRPSQASFPLGPAGASMAATAAAVAAGEFDCLSPAVQGTNGPNDLLNSTGRLEVDGTLLPRQSRVFASYDKPQQPAYPATVLFKYPAPPPGTQSSLSDDEVADLCFPNQVAPRRLRRSPSWSSLYGVINNRANITLGTAYIFMVKSISRLPLYGVCYMVEEPLHRPPSLAQSIWPACAAPYRQCLITAPRCYCITSHYPFFNLLCQALNLVVGLERMSRSLAFTLELQSDRSLYHPVLSPPGPSSASQVAASQHQQQLLEQQHSGQNQPLQQQRSGQQQPLQQQQRSEGHQPLQQQRSDQQQLAQHQLGQQQSSESHQPLQQQSGQQQPEREQHEDSQGQQHQQKPVSSFAVAASEAASAAGLAEGAVAALTGARADTVTAPGSLHSRTAAIPGSDDAMPETAQPSGALAMGRALQEAIASEPRQPASTQPSLGYSPALGGTPPHTSPMPIHAALLTQPSIDYAPLALASPLESIPHTRWHALNSFPRQGSQPETDDDDMYHSIPATGVAAARQVLRQAAVPQLTPVDSMQLEEETEDSPWADFEAHAAQQRMGSSSSADEMYYTARVPVATAQQALRAAGSPASQQAAVQSRVSRPVDSDDDEMYHSIQAPGLATRQALLASSQPASPPASQPAASQPVTSRPEDSDDEFYQTVQAPGITAQQVLHTTAAGAVLGQPNQAQPGTDSEDEMYHTVQAAGGARQLLQQAIASASSQPHPEQSLASDAQQKHTDLDRASQLISATQSSYTSQPQQGVGNLNAMAERLAGATPSIDVALPGEAASVGPREGLPVRHGSDSAEADGADSADVIGPDSAEVNAADIGSLKSTPRADRHNRHLSMSSFHTAAGTEDPEDTPLSGSDLLPGWSPGASASASPAAQSSRLAHANSPGISRMGSSSARHRHTFSRESAQRHASSQNLPTPVEVPDSQSSSEPPITTQECVSDQVPELKPPPTAGLKDSKEVGPGCKGDAGATGSYQRLPSPVRSSSSVPDAPGTPAAHPSPPMQAPRVRSTTQSSATSSTQSSDTAPHAQPQPPADAEATITALLTPASASAAAETGAQAPGTQEQGQAATAAQPLGEGLQGPGGEAGVVGGGPVSRNISRDGPGPLAGHASNGGSDAVSRHHSEVGTSQFSPLSVLDALVAASVPTPGDYVQVPLNGLPALTCGRWLLPRRWPVLAPAPALAAYAEDELAAELAPWATAVLARTLPLPALINLLSAALLERPIVFFHPDPALLTSCVLGVLPMLRPFAWQCVVVPMIPLSTMSLLDAPVPFLVGCQYKTAEISSRCTSLVRVNLYKGSLSNASNLPPLPGLKRLTAALSPHYERLRASEAAYVGARADKAGHPVAHVVPEEQVHAAGMMLWEIYVHLAGMPTAQPPATAGPHLDGMHSTPLPATAPATHMTGSATEPSPGAGPTEAQSGPSNESGGFESASSAVSMLNTAAHAAKPASPVPVAAAATNKNATSPGAGQSSAGGAWGHVARPPTLWAGVVGELRPHMITHVSADGARTATLLRDSLLEVQAVKDRPWVKAFLDTQMFQVYSDQVMAAFCEGRRWD